MKIVNICVLAALLSISAVAREQRSDQVKRLILKDGSYELITRYEITGARVRYFSSERNGWEELPESLIDWKATQEFAKQASREVSDRKKDALKRAEAERLQEEAREPEVSPGIRLPVSGGAYILDTYQDQPVLNRLVQNGADLKKNTGSNILRGVINPIAGPRQTVELPGLHARIQSHAAVPAIFFSIDPDDPESRYDSRTAQNHLRIVRCEEKKGNRVVLALDIAIYGKVRQRREDIEVNVEPVSDYWVKITPRKELPKGEYALVEFDEEGAANQFVWDFGVNPSAPANPPGVRPDVDKAEPVLIQKPRKSNP